MERKLVAILAADVVGYSRLMERDEADTFQRLRAHRKELFEPEIEKHHGRVFKLMGDGLLAEFGSVVDAVECAVLVQREMAQRNDGLPGDRRIDVRIGINLGDVIVEADDIHGDGVNIAARLQGLAKPGGIVLSSQAYDQVKHKVAVDYESLGEQAIKNIAEPVRIYRVLTALDAVGKTVGIVSSRKRSWRWQGIAATLVVLAAAGTAAWLRPWEPKPEMASVERAALPLPDKPSLAVLPFANMSGDPQQEYFADGMTDDLITDLSQISGLFVIARNSSFAYEGKAVDVRAISRELGVRYVLEGSIQRSADRIRINAQLIDATTGGHQWAERFEGSPADIFALQDRVTSRIADALALRLTAPEQQSVAQQETKVPEAYDALLRGWELYRRTTPEDYAKAVSHFEESIRQDQSYARAYAALALIYMRSYQRGWTESLGITRNEAYGRAKRYLDMANEQHTTSTSRQVAGLMFTSNSRYDAAIAAFDDAITRDPGDSWSYAYRPLPCASPAAPPRLNRPSTRPCGATPAPHPTSSFCAGSPCSAWTASARLPSLWPPPPASIRTTSGPSCFSQRATGISAARRRPYPPPRKPPRSASSWRVRRSRLILEPGNGASRSSTTSCDFARAPPGGPAGSPIQMADGRSAPGVGATGLSF
jgi:adenylate cyclase